CVSVVQWFCLLETLREPTMDDVQRLRRRIQVALGQEPADLVLKGGQIVNVFTQRIEPANVAIVDGWIAAVGPYDWKARETIDISGRFVLPGFIDPHMHLESTLLTPAELARLIVPLGTTAIISDSHEIGNVLGIPGIDMLLSASDDTWKGSRLGRGDGRSRRAGG
ncbi:MAG: amidohydrolase family protein, partial [Planctomycetes bacterium]|nr:amidohydrolase family protein [Planctomycetota bacterium]